MIKSGIGVYELGIIYIDNFVDRDVNCKELVVPILNLQKYAKLGLYDFTLIPIHLFTLNTKALFI